MPAQSADPGIDEQREDKAVGSIAHHHAGEERQGELDPAHRAGCGSDQRAVMPCRVGQRRADDCLAVWAIPAVDYLRGAVPVMARS